MDHRSRINDHAQNPQDDPLMNQPIPYGRQTIEEDDISAVVEVLRGDWLTQGPKIGEFEQALAAFTGAKFAVAVSSGTAALHLACLAAGVQPGTSGVTSAITFVASSNAVAYCGGTPGFADVDLTTGLIDLDSLEAKLRKMANAGLPPRVVLPVSFTGQCPDLTSIQDLARRFGAMVIEDAAHSLGATYRDSTGKIHSSASCTHTDMAILSFHPVKTVTTGEGGAITTNDLVLAETLRKLRTHGIHRNPGEMVLPQEGPWYYEQNELGFHYRLTDFQCALGITQLRKIDRYLQSRREIASFYREAIVSSGLDRHLQPCAEHASMVTHGYHLFPIRLLKKPGESLEQLGQRRKALFLHMKSQGFSPQVHYIPVPMQPFYQKQYGERMDQYPTAHEFYSGVISLPIWPNLPVASREKTIVVLKNFLENA